MAAQSLLVKSAQTFTLMRRRSRPQKSKIAKRPGPAAIPGRKEKAMRTLKIIYEHKTANGDWLRKEYTTDSGKDWERVVNIIHQNRHEYRVIDVKHV